MDETREKLKSILKDLKENDKGFTLLYSYQLLTENLYKILDNLETLSDKDIQRRIDFIENLNTTLEDYIQFM